MQWIIVVTSSSCDIDLYLKIFSGDSKLTLWDPSQILEKGILEKYKTDNVTFISGRLETKLLSGNIIFLTDRVNITEILVNRLSNLDGSITQYFDTLQPLSSNLFYANNLIVEKNMNDALQLLYPSEMQDMDVMEDDCICLSSQIVEYITREEFISYYDVLQFAKEKSRSNGLLMDVYMSHQSNFIERNVKILDKTIISKLLWASFTSISRAGRKNILYLIHADFHRNAVNNVGGTQYHLKDLVTQTSLKFNTYVIARDNNGFRLTLYSDGREQSCLIKMNDSDIGRINYKKAYSDLYGFILDILQIDFVHIHHTFNMSLGMFEEAKKRNIPIVYTAHDYYSVCPLIKRKCNLTPESSRCNLCLQKNYIKNVDVGCWDRWIKEYQKCLDSCSCIVTPSVSSKNIILETFPQIEKKTKVIEHGMLFSTPIGQPVYNREKFRVAFIGDLSIEKGAAFIEELTKNNRDIEWHVFGTAEGKYSNENIKIHGPYNRNDIVNLLKTYKINIVCILSIWAETYCYTLSEAVIAGIPVLVTNQGAVAERTNKMGCGWVLPDNPTTKDIIDMINNVKDNRKLYEMKCNQIQKLQFITNKEMGEAYIELYDKVIENKNMISLHADLSYRIKSYFDVLKQDQKYDGESKESQFPDLVYLNSKINTILNSRGIRFLKKINNYRKKVINLCKGK